MIQSQLGDLAVKKKLKRIQRDGSGGESEEDEDSQIDRHDEKLEGGSCLLSSSPTTTNQLLSSSPRHGRMKTFVVTFTFVPFGGLAGLPCLPPLHNDNLNLNLTFSFRLCNLGTLKRSHTGRGGGGSEEDGGRVGGEVHHHHKPAPREKALGLGDISSDSSGSRVGEKASESELEEESPRRPVGQVRILLVR